LATGRLGQPEVLPDQLKEGREVLECCPLFFRPLRPIGDVSVPYGKWKHAGLREHSLDDDANEGFGEALRQPAENGEQHWGAPYRLGGGVVDDEPESDQSGHKGPEGNVRALGAGDDRLATLGLHQAREQVDELRLGGELTLEGHYVFSAGERDGGAGEGECRVDY
jgi:hypothetical protein